MKFCFIGFLDWINKLLGKFSIALLCLFSNSLVIKYQDFLKHEIDCSVELEFLLLCYKIRNILFVIIVKICNIVLLLLGPCLHAKFRHIKKLHWHSEVLTLFTCYEETFVKWGNEAKSLWFISQYFRSTFNNICNSRLVSLQKLMRKSNAICTSWILYCNISCLFVKSVNMEPLNSKFCRPCDFESCFKVWIELLHPSVNNSKRFNKKDSFSLPQKSGRVQQISRVFFWFN